MAIGARWHFDAPSLGTEQRSSYDPLTDPVYEAPMPPISLDTSEAKLNDHAKSLLAQEARLFDEGVVCEIKDKPDTTCLACPISCHRDTGNPKGLLCRISQEQERVGTVLVAKRAGLTPAPVAAGGR